MKPYSKHLIIIFLISFFSCNEAKKLEKFSNDKPYSIEIKKERSYFQARKIADRLSEMGIETYIISKTDTADGEWFSVLSGALENIDSVKNYQKRIEKIVNIEGINVVNYNELKNFAIANAGDTSIIREKKKIISKKPDAPQAIYATIEKFPESNNLFINQLSIINLDSNLLKKTLLISGEMGLDLPRGITLSKLAKECTTFSEVRYRDNLYGGNVTLSIMKTKNMAGNKSSASFLNISEPNYYEIPEIFANYILDTDNYLYENKTQVEIPSFVKLYGYRVAIKTKKDVLRNYYILIDANLQYLIFSQSTEKTDKEFIKMLMSIGNGDGLNNYDEFFNTFYILPEKNIDGDVFLGFNIDKLDKSYAKNKGYTKWSNEMVGHWTATGYFNNEKNGIWGFTLFDLLTKSKQDYIYGSLYASHKTDNKDETEICGVKGYAVYYTDYNWWTGISNKRLSEMNFGIDRYVYAISNSYTQPFKEEDLIKRAESMQFKRDRAIKKEGPLASK